MLGDAGVHEELHLKLLDQVPGAIPPTPPADDSAPAKTSWWGSSFEKDAAATLTTARGFQLPKLGGESNGGSGVGTEKGSVPTSRPAGVVTRPESAAGVEYGGVVDDARPPPTLTKDMCVPAAFCVPPPVAPFEPLASDPALTVLTR